jgi:hypothetical protein
MRGPEGAAANCQVFRLSSIGRLGKFPNSGTSMEASECIGRGIGSGIGQGIISICE